MACSRGFSTELAPSVHIPRVSQLAAKQNNLQIVAEIAHAHEPYLRMRVSDEGMADDPEAETGSFTCTSKFPGTSSDAAKLL